MCFPPTLRNDFMLMAEWSREKWDSLEFPFPASSHSFPGNAAATAQLTRHLTLPMSAVSGAFLIREGRSVNTLPSLRQVCWTGKASWSRSGGDDVQAAGLRVDVLPWAAAVFLLNYYWHAEGHTPPHVTCDETWFSLTCRNFSLCLLWPKNHRMSQCFFLHNFS